MKNPFIITSLVISSVFFVATTLETTKGTIDLEDLFNYANQDVPSYITKDNTPSDNPITDVGATLGRVLFYDKNLSVDNSISCASCHQQAFAFGDTALISRGVNGETFRHSMRLVNIRFGEEEKMFWDERAESVEDQATQPIKDHIEMAFSGEEGNPDFDDLLEKLSDIDYYAPLFTAAFGDAAITEERMQKAIAQFVRSIQSFDTDYDIGRAQVSSDTEDFPNFTGDENAGKSLFMGELDFYFDTLTTTGAVNGTVTDTVAWRSETSAGLGCASCHRPPEFDIDPNSLGNGKARDALDEVTDFGNHRSPSLRDVLADNGRGNGGFFHMGRGNGNFNFETNVADHYDFVKIVTGNQTSDYDPRILPEGRSQFLNMTQEEKDQLHAFIMTLTGTSVYTDERWSDPFNDDGSLAVIGSIPDNDGGGDDDGNDDDDDDGNDEGDDDGGNDDGSDGGSSDDGSDDDGSDGGNDDNGSDDEPLSAREEVKEIIQVYPNPIQDQLIIEGQEKITKVFLYNLSGKLLETYELNAFKTDISFENFKTGTYIIKCAIADKLVTKTLIKH